MDQEITVTTKEQAEACLKELALWDGFVAVDCETEPFDFDNPRKSHAHQLALEGLGLYFNGKGFFILPELLGGFESVLSRKKVVAQNWKFDSTVLDEFGWNTSKWLYLVEDTMVMSWLLDENKESHGLKQNAEALLGVVPVKFNELPKKPVRGADLLYCVPDIFETDYQKWLNSTGHYCIADCRNTLALHDLYRREMPESLWKFYYEVALPLVGVIRKMERRGMKLDVEYLEKMKLELEKETDRLRKAIYKDIGRDNINLESPLQLRKYLYEERGMEITKTMYTKTGKPSTDSETLSYLAKTYKLPLLDNLVRYRELQKILGTYAKGLLEKQIDGVIYGQFQQTGTTTGRFSSKDPNLQNIPRGESGYDIRKAFVARPGYTFVISDYSQEELRIAAFMSKDEAMTKAFADGEDLHQKTATAINSTRTLGKILNFAILYGKTAYGLALSEGITEDEADLFIDKYFKQYPGVEAFMKEAVKKVQTQGYVETVLGRRRRFPEYASAQRRGAQGEMKRMERQAGNSIVQGSAADIALKAMVNLDRRLRGEDAHILCMIHDELIVEVPEDRAEEFKSIVQEEMENAVSLTPIVNKAEPHLNPFWNK